MDDYDQLLEQKQRIERQDAARIRARYIGQCERCGGDYALSGIGVSCPCVTLAAKDAALTASAEREAALREENERLTADLDVRTQERDGAMRAAQRQFDALTAKDAEIARLRSAVGEAAETIVTHQRIAESHRSALTAQRQQIQALVEEFQRYSDQAEAQANKLARFGDVEGLRIEQRAYGHVAKALSDALGLLPAAPVGESKP